MLTLFKLWRIIYYAAQTLITFSVSIFNLDVSYSILNSMLFYNKTTLCSYDDALIYPPPPQKKKILIDGVLYYTLKINVCKGYTCLSYLNLHPSLVKYVKSMNNFSSYILESI